jgi:hypothetical protein
MLEAMISVILEALFGAIACAFKRVWRAGAESAKRPPPIMKALGWLSIAGLVGLCLVNLYWLIVSGLVFRPAGGDRAGWISNADHPVAFVAWSAIWSTPVVVAALPVVGLMVRRRAHRRAAFRHVADGIAPAPRVQIVASPECRSDRPAGTPAWPME